MEEEHGFFHWWKNIFWYHYKWIVIAVLFFGSAFGFLIYDSVVAEKADAYVFMVLKTPVSQEALKKFEVAAESAIGDLNGDGTASVSVAYAALWVGSVSETPVPKPTGPGTTATAAPTNSAADNLSMQSLAEQMQKITFSYLNNDFVLYITEESDYITELFSPSAAASVSDSGEAAISLSDSSLLKSCGFPDVDYYAGLKKMSSSDKTDPSLYYAPYIRFIKTLMD